ncbi:MAG: sensor histidine kinase [Pseudolabrys sp.]
MTSIKVQMSKSPIVEGKPQSDDIPNDELRSLQQEILVKLGVIALQGTKLPELLDKTASLAAEGLQAEFCKILEYRPSENRFLVTAGVGWDPNVIGVATVGADMESPAGFALATGKPVISNHLENEERFRTPQLLLKHGIRRAMNVILQGDGTPYGVLEVDSRSEGEFSIRDISFLQGAANILGMAIERHRIESNLRAALERNQLLLREANHRVNNSLALVASMLHLKAATVNDEVKAHLGEASNRITAIARAHQRLYQTEKFETLDLGAYLGEICRNLAESLPGCEIHVSMAAGLEIPPDIAIPIALLVNELVTNAAKHGRADSKCEMWVTVSLVGERTLTISVRDNGPGLPTDFDLNAQKGLGMRLVTGFSKQVGGDLVIHRHQPGVEFVLAIPI